MLENKLTRKDVINRSEEFLSSAFNGICRCRNDNSVSQLRSFLGRLVQSEITAEDEKPKANASRNDMHNAEILVKYQPRLRLSPREAKLIYLKAHCRLPWKRIAEILGMSWDIARRTYEDILHDMYYAFIRDHGR